MAVQLPGTFSFEATATVVSTPKPHVVIGFQPYQAPNANLKDQLLISAIALPKETLDCIKKALDALSVGYTTQLFRPLGNTIQTVLDQLPEGMKELEYEIDVASANQELQRKTTLAMNRALGDDKGKLSAEGIARVLAAHATSIPEDQRKALAMQLARAPVESASNSSKESKGKVPAPSDDRKDSGVNGQGLMPAERLQVPEFPPREEEECVIFHRNNLAVRLISNCIRLEFVVPGGQVDRVQDLVARVEKVEPKMVVMIKAAMKRFFEERCVPDNKTPGCDVSVAIDARKKEVASKHPGVAIEVDQSALERYIDFAARSDLNLYIYSGTTNSLFKKGFQLDSIAGILSMMGQKMKQEGSKDPFCGWTEQQFTEVLQKALA